MSDLSLLLTSCTIACAGPVLGGAQAWLTRQAPVGALRAVNRVWWPLAAAVLLRADYMRNLSVVLFLAALAVWIDLLGTSVPADVPSSWRHEPSTPWRAPGA